MENKPANLLVVCLGKTLNGIPRSLGVRPMVKQSDLAVTVAQ